MTRRVQAIFENGVLRPLDRLEGVPEHAQVQVSVEYDAAPMGGVASCVGIMPDADAQEMLEFVDREFEQVDLREWK